MKLSFIYPNVSQLEMFLATKQYEAIWHDDATKIVEAFHEITNLEFKQRQIKVKVHDGGSVSGAAHKPMRLNVNNRTIDEKRAALLHELGHRLLGGNGINSMFGADTEFVEDEERRLGLFIFDVYKRVYGQSFVQSYIARSAKLDEKGDVGYGQSMSSGIFFTRKLTIAQRQRALERLIETNKLEL